jgi:hypothetical protein
MSAMVRRSELWARWGGWRAAASWRSRSPADGSRARSPGHGAAAHQVEQPLGSRRLGYGDACSQSEQVTGIQVGPDGAGDSSLVHEGGGGVVHGFVPGSEEGSALVAVTEHADDTVRVRSKGLSVMADGRAGTVTYEDTVVRTPAGWRIALRKVVTAPGAR